MLFAIWWSQTWNASSGQGTHLVGTPRKRGAANLGRGWSLDLLKANPGFFVPAAVKLPLTSLQVESLREETLLVTKSGCPSNAHLVLEHSYNVNNAAELTHTSSVENSLNSERSSFIFVKLHILVFPLNCAFTYCPPFRATANIFMASFRCLTHSWFLALVCTTGCSRWFLGLIRSHNLERAMTLFLRKHFILCQLRRGCCPSHGTEDGGQGRSGYSSGAEPLFLLSLPLPSFFPGDTTPHPHPLFIAPWLLPKQDHWMGFL